MMNNERILQIMDKALQLCGISGIDVFASIQNTTECVCVQVKKGNSIHFESKVFFNNEENLMILEKQLEAFINCGRNIMKTASQG